MRTVRTLSTATQMSAAKISGCAFRDTELIAVPVSTDQVKTWAYNLRRVYHIYYVSESPDICMHRVSSPHSSG